ncbi:8849_t:CDS:1 [Cetraspora pellucida]|uniref:8849_t:CDS:1 n=1 Tax=Cetraspora pellucida TaxID=1433469 RepID=A0A9N8VWD5_9GLOM|nr:8849_t:CDS:1 [Cetraspora pellucida]
MTMSQPNLCFANILVYLILLLVTIHNVSSFVYYQPIKKSLIFSQNGIINKRQTVVPLPNAAEPIQGPILFNTQEELIATVDATESHSSQIEAIDEEALATNLDNEEYDIFAVS